MLRALRCENFKALREVTLGLTPMTVLVGANGVGKSTALQAVRLLSELSEADGAEVAVAETTALSRLETLARTPRWILDRFSSGAPHTRWAVEAHLEGTALSVSGSAAGLLVRLGDGAPALVAKSPSENSNAQLFRDLAQSPPLRAFGLQASFAALASAAHADTPDPRVAEDGSGLPAVIADLAINDPAALDAIRADLHSIVPQTGRFRAPRERVSRPVHETDDEGLSYTVQRQVWGHRLELEIDGAGFVPAAHVSEGTLRALAILCVLAKAPPDTPFVMLCDDFDAGLHPKAQTELVATFRKIMAQRPNVQFLLTTHSPYALDAFEGQEVVVLARRPDGSAAARRVNEHPEWEAWAQQLRVGEFWSSMGEAWVAEEVPAEVDGR